MITTEKIKERLEDFPAACKKAGLKVTQQRTAVFTMLATSASHPSPEEIFEAINPKAPSVSLATVYKILDTFHSHGFIKRVSSSDKLTRYDANIEQHHHLICRSCGKISDIHIKKIPAEFLQIPDAFDFKAASHEILFHGTCATC